MPALLIVLLALGVVRTAAAGSPADRAVTVAILYFDYDGKDEQLSYLRKGLNQMLVADLSDVGGVNLVERVNLEAVLKELKLNRSSKIDRKSANRIGKLLGAKHLVMGHYFHLYGTLQVSARIVDVETGALKAVTARRKAADFLDLEQELASKLRVRLGAIVKASAAKGAKRPRPKHRKKPKSKARKRPRRLDTSTVASYGKALDAMDRGNKAEAKKLLAQVVKVEPDFRLAATDLANLSR